MVFITHTICFLNNWQDINLSLTTEIDDRSAGMLVSNSLLDMSGLTGVFCDNPLVLCTAVTGGVVCEVMLGLLLVPLASPPCLAFS